MGWGRVVTESKGVGKGGGVRTSGLVKVAKVRAKDGGGEAEEVDCIRCTGRARLRDGCPLCGGTGKHMATP
jgi:hypothetical protein